MAAAAPRLVAHLTNDVVSVFCPGCQMLHTFYVGPTPDANGKVVAYNGQVSAGPTFSGILSTLEHPQAARHGPACAFAIVKGVIGFAADCRHPLAGKSVPLPSFPAGTWPGDKVPANSINRTSLP